MSPAILSRFEKHELQLSHLLDDVGDNWMSIIQLHPIWQAVKEVVDRQKLLPGYHEDSLQSLAFHMQETGGNLEEKDVNCLWMRAVDPKEMIKLEGSQNLGHRGFDVCTTYRAQFVLDGIANALDLFGNSKRVVIVTNTPRHVPIALDCPKMEIALFNIQCEQELNEKIASISAEQRENPKFYLLVQYDATKGPIQQFQFAKYEIEAKMRAAVCKVVFVTYVDPRPGRLHWVFSFGDGWEYLFVDEISPSSQVGSLRLPLSELVRPVVDRPISDIIGDMSNDIFKSLLLDCCGPHMQGSLINLRSGLGAFYGDVRKALGLAGNEEVIQLLKEW